jgi:glycopeptide antibiotics resistance protein
MAMRQWPKFPSKEASCRDKAQEDMVAFHQSVLKSTTRARLVALVYLVCLVDLVHLVRFIQPNKPDEPNKPQSTSPIGLELPFILALMYSHRMMRGKRP